MKPTILIILFCQNKITFGISTTFPIFFFYPPGGIHGSLTLSVVNSDVVNMAAQLSLF